MPYIEWHHSIRHHHKTDHLAELLKIEPYAALGLRGCLYAWAIDERPGGIIERDLLAVAARWPRNKRATLEAALIESKLIDSVDDKTVQIHDWQDYTRGYRKSKADIERRRNASQPSNGSATVAQQTRDNSATVAVSGTDQNGTERSSEAVPSALGPPPPPKTEEKSRVWEVKKRQVNQHLPNPVYDIRKADPPQDTRQLCIWLGKCQWATKVTNYLSSIEPNRAKEILSELDSMKLNGDTPVTFIQLLRQKAEAV
jgi:hypothetical protein